MGVGPGRAIADGAFHDPLYRLIGGDPQDYEYSTPTVELSVHFHRAAPGSEWLFCRARCDQAAAGLVTSSARIPRGDRKRVQWAREAGSPWQKGKRCPKTA
ncbi:MAG: thioesterase family protein [Myxococcales bacterium]|nr:thioesterase family protein [Myxococcales bacterium]